MLEHVLAAGGEATTERRPAHRAARGRRHAGRGAARPQAAGAARDRLGRGARRGRARPARRTHDASSGWTTSRCWRRRSAASGQVDGAAAGAAFEAVRRLELLLDLWGAEPPSALRSGGLGVRDLKATAAALHVDEADRGAARRDRLGAPACWPPPPTATATRCGCRPTWSTPGCCGRPPSAGPGWPAPGWTARGCRGWSAPATPPASRGTRWRPSWPAATWPRPAR